MSERRAPMPWARFGSAVARNVLDPGVLMFAAIIAALLTFALGAMRSPVLLVPGLIVALFATSALIKYATLTLRAIAVGLPVPAAPDTMFSLSEDFWAYTPWLGLALVNAVGLLLLRTLGDIAALVYLAAVLPLLPAAVAVIALSRRPLQVLRLAALLRIVRLIGADYLKILLGWAVIFALAALLRSYPGLTLSLAAVFAGCLQILFVCAATGVVVFYHRDALGVPIQRDSKTRRQRAAAEQSRVRARREALDTAYGLFSRDNAVGGMSALRGYLVDTDPDDDGAWPWFFEQMLGWETPQPALVFARNYFRWLLQRGDTQTARALLEDCLALDPMFAVHPDDRAAAQALLAVKPDAD